MKKLKIKKFALADADIYFRSILKQKLEISPFHEVISQCGNGRELINQLYKKQEDVFIIDLFMPILTGIEAIKIIREKKITTPILAYSNTFQEDIAKLITAYPNVYYCQKSSPVIFDILNNCILNQSKSFETYYSNWRKNPLEVQEYMKRQQKNCYVPNLIEIHIMRLSFEGMNNREIADKLNLSPRTIDTYIKRLTEKIGVKNKLELSKYTVENGYHNFSL